MVTCGAGYISVPRKDLVVKEQLTERGLLFVELNEVGCCQRFRFVREDRRDRGKDKRNGMRKTVTLFLFLAAPAFADIEEARDLMEEGKFEQAREALLPAARSGNADAEELIGVMYAMGLGVPRDDVRAFEWYLRSSMKGHAGAQSGVGWYYEVGRGLPAPDLVRAYMWYTLSAIGGDPDAAISLEEVVKKMTPEQIEKAHTLVDDYKVWMYPFR